MQCGSFDIINECSSTKSHGHSDIKKDRKTIAMSFLLCYSKIAFLGQFLNFAKETQTS